MNTELINFWQYASVGHASSKGIDTTQHFLVNLFEQTDNLIFSDCKIYSHFNPNSRATLTFKQLRSKVRTSLSRDKFLKRLRLHGYNHDLKKLNISKANVWYTPENLRPPLHEAFAIFLSHDLDKYDGRNIYLPIWATRLGKTISSAMEEQENLLQSRVSCAKNKKAICAVISNPEPVRMAFLTELKKHFEVDIYGAFGLTIVDKKNTLENYRLNVCFENDEFPGYVTEKPIEAWMSGCIPIWRGLDAGGFLNEKAIINVTKLGFEESVKRISSILKNDEQYIEISSYPILNKGYDYVKLKNEVNKLIVAVK